MCHKNPASWGYWKTSTNRISILFYDKINAYWNTKNKVVWKQMGTLQNEDFGSKSRRVWKFCRRHIIDISRIKFLHATQRLGKKTIFQGSLTLYRCFLSVRPAPEKLLKRCSFCESRCSAMEDPAMRSSLWGFSKRCKGIVRSISIVWRLRQVHCWTISATTSGIFSGQADDRIPKAGRICWSAPAVELICPCSAPNE